MKERKLREAAEKWIYLALAEELRQADPHRVRELAEMIDSIAGDYDVPVEEALRWIHSEAFEDTPAAWVRHCQQYASLRQRLCSAESPEARPQ